MDGREGGCSQHSLDEIELVEFIAEKGADLYPYGHKSSPLHSYLH